MAESEHSDGSSVYKSSSSSGASSSSSSLISDTVRGHLILTVWGGGEESLILTVLGGVGGVKNDYDITCVLFMKIILST